MLQSDTLANEFNDILNGVEIFAPFQPLDPAITFYAPLRNNVRDLRLNEGIFERASDAWYKDGSGVYRNVGINRARFEESRLLMEPAGTNVCVNYNANPDSELSALVSSQTLRRIFNPADLMAAGLQDICPSGYVIELENEGGETGGVYVNGGTGTSTAVWTASGFINTFGNNVRLTITGTGSFLELNSNQLERFEYTATADGNFRVWQITNVAPGAKVQFVLNQLEESPSVTSPIVTEGTAGQRALDDLRYENLLNFFNLSEGMLIFGFRPIVASADYPLDSFAPKITMIAGSINGASYVRKTAGGAVTLSSYDGTNAPASVSAIWAALDPLWVAVRFGSGEKQIGVYDSGWSWGSIQAHSDFANDGNLYIHELPIVPTYLHDIEVYNEDRGTAWIEANYP